MSDNLSTYDVQDRIDQPAPIASEDEGMEWCRIEGTVDFSPQMKDMAPPILSEEERIDQCIQESAMDTPQMEVTAISEEEQGVSERMDRQESNDAGGSDLRVSDDQSFIFRGIDTYVTRLVENETEYGLECGPEIDQTLIFRGIDTYMIRLVENETEYGLECGPEIDQLIVTTRNNRQSTRVSKVQLDESETLTIEFAEAQNRDSLNVFCKRDGANPTETSPNLRVKIRGSFQLTNRDRDAILNGDKFHDQIIDAAQVLIDDRLGNEHQSCLLKWTGFQPRSPTSPRSIQILHSETDRWVLCEKRDSKVFFMDSVNHAPSPDVVRQITQLHPECVSNGMLHIHIRPVQIQSNNMDSGVFAIANAFQLVTESVNSSLVWYDESKMRRHLIGCLEEQSVLPFPKFGPLF